MTDPSPQKQAQVHEQSDLLPSPTEAATSLISLAVESLLQPIQPTSLNFARQSLTTFRQIEKQKRSLASLKQENYIPHSARLSFTLNASKRVMEMAAFKTLQQSTQTLLASFQSQLKDYIVAVAELELKALEHQLAEITHSLIAYLSKTFIIVAPHVNDNDENVSAVYFLAHQSLYTYEPIKLLTEDEKQTLLLPFSRSVIPTALEYTQLTLFQPIANRVVAAVNSLCISPSQKYIEQADTNAQHLKIKNVMTSLKNDTLAAKTTMTIDTKPTVKVTPKLLQTLIDESVKKALAQHAHCLSLKEVQGATDNDTSTGASLKKKLENDKKAATGRILAAAHKKINNGKKAATGRQATSRDYVSANKKIQKGGKRK